MRLDPQEPANVARMAALMNLRYVVITCVNRDDLEDGGSRHFAETVRQVKRLLADARVEVLTSDFCGDLEAVACVLDAAPHVFNHNMETAARLYPLSIGRLSGSGSGAREQPSIPAPHLLQPIRHRAREAGGKVMMRP